MARVSLIPEILDGIVSALRATSGFRAPDGTADGITVYDGPEWATFAGPDPDGLVVVGWGGEDLTDREGPNDPAGPAAGGPVSVRAIATTSPKVNDQDDIPCVAWYRSGAVDTSAARTAALAIVDSVDTVLRAAPTVGISPSSDGQVFWVQVTDRSLLQYLHPGGGSVAQVEFTLTAKSRT